MYFLFVALFKRHNQIGFIEKVQKIDDAIRHNFNISINYSSFKVISLATLIVVFFYYNIMVSGVLYIFLLNIRSPSALATFFVYIFQSGTSGIFTYGFVGYVTMIKFRLTKINEQLEAIVRFTPEILEKQYKTKEALCKEMMRYTKMYKSLCSCVEDLNQIYGSSMVLHFAHDFTLLTTQIFAMFYIGFYDDPEQSLFKILALLVWLLPNVIKMSLICLNCHMTRNEVKAFDHKKFKPRAVATENFLNRSQVFWWFPRFLLIRKSKASQTLKRFYFPPWPFFIEIFTFLINLNLFWNFSLLDWDVRFVFAEIQQRSERRRTVRPRRHVLPPIDSSQNGIFGQQLLLHRHVSVFHDNFRLHNLFGDFNPI